MSTIAPLQRVLNAAARVVVALKATEKKLLALKTTDKSCRY